MKTSWIVKLAIAACLAFGATAHGASTEVVVRSTKGEFKEVKERLMLAIEGRGLVLNYTARIGAMLDRTGKDIGASRRVYSDAELLEFCSAKVSRDTMEADPRNIVFCPYAIAIYALPKEPGRVYLAYRPPGTFGTESSARSLAAVDKLLAGIIAEALQ
jgi:uncharacterized protein (DUF302 family)